MTTAARLFRDHHLTVFRYLRRVVGDTARAEDLTQETFARVARAEGRYRDEGAEVAWLFRIARNVWKNELRSGSRRVKEESLDSAIEPGRNSAAEARVVLDDAIAGLPDHDREAFLLREVVGLGYAEIAEVIGGSRDGIRNRIYRARKALRSALASDSTIAPTTRNPAPGNAREEVSR